jgi:type I restriction enzyme S subunit
MSLANEFRVGVTGREVTFNQDLRALVPARDVHGPYLARFLQARQSEILGLVDEASHGTKRLTSDRFSAIEVPVPSLDEQFRIAAILDRADALRARRRAALAQLDTLTQAIFLDRFVNRGHPSVAVADVCDLITDGTHYTPTYTESGTIFLSSRNVTSRYIDWSDVKFIPRSLHEELHRRIAPKRDDVLLAKNGTTGIAAVVDRDCVFDIYVSLALLRPSRRLLPIYLREALNSPWCKRQFDASLKGIGVPNLHLKDIRRATFPLPDVAHQKAFVDIVQAIESSRNLSAAAKMQSDALFASLQHRAFRGEL